MFFVGLFKKVSKIARARSARARMFSKIIAYYIRAVFFCLCFYVSCVVCVWSLSSLAKPCYALLSLAKHCQALLSLAKPC